MSGGLFSVADSPTPMIGAPHLRFKEDEEPSVPAVSALGRSKPTSAASLPGSGRCFARFSKTIFRVSLRTWMDSGVQIHGL